MNPLTWYDDIKAIGKKLLQWSVLPLAPLIAPFLALVALWSAFMAAADSLIVKINALSAMIVAMPIFQDIGRANRMIPLAEGLAMVAVLFSLKVSCFIVRFIKSWLPTVN